MTLAATIIFSIYGKKLLSLIPILGGIIIGYLYSLAVGLVDLSPVKKPAFLKCLIFSFRLWIIK